ncbi:GPI biosynthesis protein family Pig-F-domain-containing protein [Phanerochaete sordida]|uniref:GPI biosynthesis protein family Pig-F-domain-containing protein n=1 Tax=Phanerochaete sordida TaxID=48140 RepID=A0A9P3G2A9_9APHY|nr:GPI biosynthesis protein family Pig-F-domain-containing protein [Phanerochaete sordida]
MAIQKVKAAKGNAKSSPAASPSQPPRNDADVVTANASFPFARYTSIVGVHTSLLAFTALILPRSSFADLSSPSEARSKPRKDPMTMLTENPARTLAWICFGCFVLQLWWAGWVREWRLEATLPPIPKTEDGKFIESETQKAERVMKQEEWNRQKANDNGFAVLATLAASVAYHVVLILFGAHSTSYVLQTYLLSLVLALLTIYAPVYALGLPTFKGDTESLVRRLTWVRLFAELAPRTPVERALVYPAVGTVLGCWSGVIPIGLDWDRPWQAWPLTPAWGAIGGYVLGSLLALGVSNVKEVIDLGVAARRDDELSKKPSKKGKKKNQ